MQSKEMDVMPSGDPDLDILLKDFELTNATSHLLRRAHMRAEDIFFEEAGKDGLTPRQKSLLIKVYRHAGANQSWLAAQTAIDKNSFAEIVFRMVKQGYLKRQRALHDARAYQLFITPKGIDALKDVVPIAHQVEEIITQPLPPELRPLFIKCLKIMIGDDSSKDLA